MSKGAFTARTVDLIWQRDLAMCVRCQAPLYWGDRGVGWSVHHRTARGMGGTRLAWVSGAANGLLLCGSGTTGCHGHVETNRSEAYEFGWLVRRHGRLKPAEVPVLYPDGHSYLLDDAGGKLRWQ